jgi:ornithine cyclodeaminase
MRVILRGDVEAALPMRACIDLMETVFRSIAGGRVVQPRRTVVRGTDGRALYVMPALVESEHALSTKLVTITPSNAERGLPTHRGVLVQMEPETGAPVALIDAAGLTAVRTAAVSALATRILARRDARVLGMLGSGVQARSHIEAMMTVRPIAVVRAWSPNREHLSAFVEEQAARGVTVHAADSAEEAVRGADIVVTATSSAEPVLERGWLADGVHINAVGASDPDARELDTATVAESSFHVDSREAALAESGDYLIPLRERAIADDHIRAELAELVTGSLPGRGADMKITVFKSLGLAVEDAVAARSVYRSCIESKRGHEIEFPG